MIERDEFPSTNSRNHAFDPQHYGSQGIEGTKIVKGRGKIRYHGPDKIYSSSNRGSQDKDKE